MNLSNSGLRVLRGLNHLLILLPLLFIPAAIVAFTSADTFDEKASNLLVKAEVLTIQHKESLSGFQSFKSLEVLTSNSGCNASLLPEALLYTLEQNRPVDRESSRKIYFEHRMRDRMKEFEIEDTVDSLSYRWDPEQFQ